MRTIDLFAGGGGMSLGFQQAGYDIIAAFDNWRPAREFYRANFDHPIIGMELEHDTSEMELPWETVASQVLLETNTPPEVIIGGPPCQDFSSAGKREEKDRANLTVSFAVIVCELFPKYFVMENVERALKSDALDEAIKMLQDNNYGITVMVLNAARCGCPQNRKRLFVIGEWDGEDHFLYKALEEGLADKPMTVREYADFGIDHYYRHPRSYKRRGVFSVDEPSPTVRGVNRPVPKGYPGHSGDTAPVKDVRPLTTKERSIIQTFPEDFDLVGTNTNVEQIVGNAVPVNLAKYVAETLLAYSRKNNGQHGREGQEGNGTQGTVERSRR